MTGAARAAAAEGAASAAAAASASRPGSPPVVATGRMLTPALVRFRSWPPPPSRRGSSRWSAISARCARRAAPSASARAGTRRRRCGCSATTSIPRWPRTRRRLVVYGGSGRAARSHEALKAIVAALLELEDDETLLVQSGKPVAVFRTHAGAPRVLIANSLLVPRFATWDEFRRLEAEGLTMFGQMTAGSWIYIGTQGILQGTYQTFAAAGETHWGSPDLAGPHRPHGRPRRDGRRPAAGRVAGRRRQPERRGRPAPDRAAPRDALPRRGRSRPRRRRRPGAAPRRRRAGRVGRCPRKRRRRLRRDRPPRRRASTSSPTRPRPTTC